MRIVAPGKIVILGEYAVLDGAPALVAAVDRGVQCIVSPAQRREILTPGDDRFVAAALADAPPGHYRFTDWRPIPTPTKVGLGGSAAATVAAVIAARTLAGAPVDAEAVRRVATRIHAEVQGSGSGIDVAASAHGGLIRVDPGGVTALPPLLPTVVFSGGSAATGPRVEQYLAWPHRDAFVEETRAWVAAFPTDPVGTLRAACHGLRRMSESATIPYWTDALQRIVDLAEAHGGSAKASGAGGGDIAIALFPDPADQERFVAAITDAGLLHVPVGLAGPAGVVLDP